MFGTEVEVVSLVLFTDLVRFVVCLLQTVSVYFFQDVRSAWAQASELKMTSFLLLGLSSISFQHFSDKSNESYAIPDKHRI